MILTDVLLYVFYAFVITTLTGAVFSAAWLLLRRYLGEGNELLLARCLRISVQFYLIPVLFCVVLWSKGDNMLCSLWMDAEDAHVILFRRTAAITWVTIGLMIMWVTGMVATFSRHLKERIRLKEVLNCSELETKPEVLACFERIRERLGIHKRIALFRSCEGSVPCTVGRIRRKIILPMQASEYSDKQLEIIFSHELMHCRRHDLFYKSEFLAANIIHMINPFAYRMREIHKEYTEIACDLMTCERMKDLFTRREYSTVLLEMAAKRETVTDSPITNMAEKKSALRRRVEAMRGYERGTRMKKGMAVAITALFIMGSSMTAFAAGNGVVALHEEFYQVTAETTTEEMNWVNTLEERVISAEEFAAYGSIVMENGLKVQRGGSQIEWPMSAGATYSTSSYRLEKGQVVTVTFYTDPEDQVIEVGLENVNGGAVSVSGTEPIGHQFTIQETGHYRLFIKNKSGIRITVSGAFTY